MENASRYQRLQTDRNKKQSQNNAKVYIHEQHTQSCPKLQYPSIAPLYNSIKHLPSLPTHTHKTSPSNHLNFHQDPINRNIMKVILKNSYQQQLKREQKRKNEQRRLKIMQEQDYLSQFQNPQKMYYQQKRKKKEEYKKQLLEEIEQKKAMVSHVKTEQTALSRKYQQPKSNHFHHKSQAFLQFYDQALKFQKRVEKQYKGYMKQEQKVANLRNKEKLIDYKQNLQLMELHSKQEYNLKKEKQINLRKILNDQIKNKEEGKKESRQSSKKRKRYTQVYNPISNPFNREIDPNNRYIVNQLLKANPKSTMMNK